MPHMRRLLRNRITALTLGLALLLAACSGAPDHYVASSKADPFHRPNCSSVSRIKSENLQSFPTRDAAIQAGHRPCETCKP